VGFFDAHALTLYWIDVGGADEHRYMQDVQQIFEELGDIQKRQSDRSTHVGAVERRAVSKILKMVRAGTRQGAGTFASRYTERRRPGPAGLLKLHWTTMSN